jgi:SAM-dependent methyltransferase
MVEALFVDPRLAAIYDDLEGDRSDLDLYLGLVDEFAAKSVLDIGCGTGTLACLLAKRGTQVIGVDPSEAMLEVARRKPGADQVRWLLGDASAVGPVGADLAVMTGNVAQVFLTDEEWLATLAAARVAIGPDGRLAFETRDPSAEAWMSWTRGESYRRMEFDLGGAVEAWVDLTEVARPFVSFRWTFTFEPEATVLTSDSTIRFRTADETHASLATAGFDVVDVRDASDRPGLEFVFIARPVRSRGRRRRT